MTKITLTNKRVIEVTESFDKIDAMIDTIYQHQAVLESAVLTLHKPINKKIMIRVDRIDTIEE